MAPATWTLAQAEQWLLSLELFGMKFGLDRVRALTALLGEPQRSFRSIHVVGSNGKSSTTRLCAAILQAHGLRVGAFLSPHLVSFTERVLVDGLGDVSAEQFAAAAARVRDAAAIVDASLTGDERVTQFEAVTVTGFCALADAGVEVAVIEAGLGGRLDATNVLDSDVQILTSVGLEHTRWLGETVAEIAAEKLDVVGSGGTLVVGPGLDPVAGDLAERVCAARGARLVTAADDPGLELLARGAFQRQNFALATAAAQALLGELDHEALRRAAGTTAIPGRLEIVSEQPLTIFDGAHNPDGLRALAAEIPVLAAGRRVVVCASILEDKDAGEMLRLLSGFADALVLATATNPRAVPAAALAAASMSGGPPIEVVPEPHAALDAAKLQAGAAGVVVVTGSLYLLADLLRPRGAPKGSIL